MVETELTIHVNDLVTKESTGEVMVKQYALSLSVVKANSIEHVLKEAKHVIQIEMEKLNIKP